MDSNNLNSIEMMIRDAGASRELDNLFRAAKTAQQKANDLDKELGSQPERMTKRMLNYAADAFTDASKAWKQLSQAAVRVEGAEDIAMESSQEASYMQNKASKIRALALKATEPGTLG